MRPSRAAAFFAGCGLLLTGSSFSRAPEIPAPGELRVASYNVNYGLAGDPETLEALVATRADIVFVQEANGAWADAFEGLREAYPHQALVDHGAAGGLAVLSRFPFESRDVIDSPVGWFPAWRVVVETPEGPLQVLQVHLHPPYDDRAGWVLGPFTTSDERELELLVAMSTLDPTLPTVVLGDMNERTGRAIRLLEARGYEDVLPRFAPGTPTWRWDLPVGSLWGTLDHIFVKGGAVAVDAEVLQAGRSDHLPIVVDLHL